MFTRLRTSWELVKASSAVLQADKKLVFFPMVSFLAMVLVTITFAVPTLLAGVIDQALLGDMPIFGFILGFIFYLVNYFVVYFFNAALIGATMISLKGGEPGLDDGLRIAMENIGAIFGYALISATIGIILKTISERAGFIGQIVVSLIGLAWNFIAYLVIPVLVVEGVGPVEGVKRSTQLLKETWGEQIGGNVGLSTIFGLIGFLTFIVWIPIMILAISSGSLLVIALGVLLIVLAFMIIGLLNATLSGIYSAALYVYAVDGEANSFFGEDVIQNAFFAKKRNKWL